jgi:DNA-binding protein HU-beta
LFLDKEISRLYKSCGVSGNFRCAVFASAAFASETLFTTIKQEDANVNKTDLIDKVAVTTELNKTSAARAVEAVLEIIAGTLREGDTVTLSGFGTFSVSNRSERSGRNPRTGEMITIPASKAPKFKSGKGLKDALN